MHFQHLINRLMMPNPCVIVIGIIKNFLRKFAFSLIVDGDQTIFSICFLHYQMLNPKLILCHQDLLL